ncbi:S41 family peptidase [Roseiflexus sp.]|uniref:S41 family peptidase n=1 Tax=Roseiflexus sp. TaxID=2562120 RepID=UPI0021DD2E47|nr:S41 family peptidase [Roseiflexus sp.]GIW01856.1 MAG: tricorn protease [Roseiflexus sp.]
MAPQGYYRWPTIHNDTVVFVCEDDLWTVPASGGVARRLTANPGSVQSPALSPDGALLAFVGRDEGPGEVFVMPAEGGEARRLTFLGATMRVCGWGRNGREILFASSASLPFSRMALLYAIRADGGEPRLLPTGPAVTISYGPTGGAVIGRNESDPARWKRYRGGRTGDVWIDPDGTGEWRRLIALPGNIAIPLWVGERIYFVSDHEGVGNLYSCLPTGDDLQRHTWHREYYARFPSTDGRRIVYHAGADLYLFDPATNTSRRIEVELRSPRTQRKRRFVDPARFLQSVALHPEGHSLAAIVRGKPFTFGNWEGAVLQHGDPGAVRYRLADWLPDGRRIVVVSDAVGEETLEIHSVAFSNGGQRAAASDAATVDAALSPFDAPVRLEGLDIGRPMALAVSPKAPLVAVANNRNELLLVDLTERTVRLLDRSRYDSMPGIAWSPDGRWLAYGFWETGQTSIIKVCEVATGTITPVTRPVLVDRSPAFDPEGKYLYFISSRDFDPVYDDMHFDLGFPRGTRPFLVTLRANLRSPFVPRPHPLDQATPKPSVGEAKPAGETGGDAPGAEGAAQGTTKSEPMMTIDLEGIANRIVAFPLPVGRYRQIAGIPGKALFTVFPVESALGLSRMPGDSAVARGRLDVYDFETLSSETLIDGVSAFSLSHDSKTLMYRAGNRVRVVKAGERPKDNSSEPGRKSGWVDLARIKLMISPPAEWVQMYREAWRLQRDHFWTPDMSGVNWLIVYHRYLPLLDRVATRGEFSDLLWEMQGELGTSHTYEYGGDYRLEPQYSLGKLGADLRYDAETDSYIVERIVAGDVWNERASSPLARPGVNIAPGDRLIAIGSRRVGRDVSPHEVLVNQAGCDVLLTFRKADGTLRAVTVKALHDDTQARYREWVERNRAIVHEAANGRVGYIHIPDMQAFGYAEFHRGFLAEVAREGLIVDVRYNAGGFVSPLVAEKLARKRLGYDVSRWGEPAPYPPESIMGPMVAIINEAAGSDGDIISHVFKMMKLGPLIGKRTWGGVIGIHPRDTLIDGGVTTQPEFSFWSAEVGWQLENHGVEPDIEVEMRPQDYVAGADPQLDRAIAEVLRLMNDNPPRLPEFGERPRLPLPEEECDEEQSGR